MKGRSILRFVSLSSAFRWTIAHPWWIVGLTLLLTVAGAAVIPWLEIDVDFTNYLDRDDPAVLAADAAKDRYGSQIRSMVILHAEAGVFTGEVLGRIEELEKAFERLPEVEEVTGPLNLQVIRGSESALTIGPAAPGGLAPTTPEGIAALQSTLMNDRNAPGYVVSRDGTAVAIYLRAERSVEMVEFAEAIEPVAMGAEGDGVQVSVAGIPYLNLTLGRSMSRDLGVFLPLIILAIVAVLYASFRWRWGVLIPLAVVGISVIWTVGLMAACRVPITVISFILPVVLMAIGIADGIHVLGRYREELGRGRSKNDAILATMNAMERPVIMTSLTTAAGFFSLVNAYMIPQRTFGVFTAVGILAAMILSLFLIPALLRLVPVPPMPGAATKRLSMSKMLEGFERRIVRARWWVLGVALVVGGVFAASFSQIEIETSQRAFLGGNHPAVLSLDLMEEYFSGGEQILIEIDTKTRDGLKKPEVLNEMVALEAFLEQEGVSRTASLADIVREMNQRFHGDDPAYYVVPDDSRGVAQLLLLFTFQGGDLGAFALGDFSAGEVIGFHATRSGAEQVELVRAVTEYLNEHFSAYGTAQMVGSTRIQASMFASIARSQIASLLTSILAAGAIVILLMGSLLYGLISLIPLLFTVAVNFGIMAFLGMPLDIATLMVSSITIGIGIDYGIHFIVRYREGLRAGLASADAAIQTARYAGRGILFNALALALGFSVLLLSAFHGMRSFGGLISMTMIISALAALTVIPALLVVIGRRKKATAPGGGSS